MGTHLDQHHNGSVIRYDSDLLNPLEPRLFDVGWLRSEGHHRGTSSGRGEAHFLSFGRHDMVLRPFRRGGLVGRFNKDLYLRTGLERTRSMQELELLSWMRGEGLRVPRPVAAKVAPFGPFYRAAIITEYIPEAQPMEEMLRESDLGEDIWQRVGEAIRQMHDAGVYHSDLNRRNILIDGESQVWLIDFDKCKRRAPGSWTTENLDRLHRSLQKQDSKGRGIHWGQEDWVALMAGYGSANSDGTASRPSL